MHSAFGRFCTWMGASITFSRIVIWDQRLKLWNTMATRERMRSTWLWSAGIIPLRLLFSAMVSPPMRISPESGTSSMLMQRSMVDLPEPEAPRIEMTSPSFALSDTPLSTSRVPKLLRRLLTETAAAASEDAGWGDKDATPLDMGGLQTRLDGRGAAQVRREPPFDGHDDARDDEVEDQIDQAGDDEDLDRAEGLRDQLRGKARSLPSW